MQVFIPREEEKARQTDEAVLTLIGVLWDGIKYDRHKASLLTCLLHVWELAQNPKREMERWDFVL